MKSTSLPALLTATVLLAINATSTSFAAERHEQKELPAADGGTLTFKAVVGSVEIKTHDQDKVSYSAEIKPGNRLLGFGSAPVEDLVFAYETSGADVTITMKWKDDQRPRNVNLSARHTLLIPNHYHLDVQSAGGKIHGEDIHGNVIANTSGGGIRFGRVNGDIKARTSGGGITVADVEGNVEVKTSGGSIQVGNVAGNVAASTSGGGIKLGAVTGEVQGSTSGGSISAELVAQIAQPLELSTSGGGIKLAVPGDFKADLDARTSGGGVDCELPIQGTIKRSSIAGQLNGGGPKVTLRTSGGSIKVSKR